MSTRPNKTTPIATGTKLTYKTPIGEAVQIIGSDDWFKWLDGENNTRFYCEAFPYAFTARREKRRKGFFWYAYMKLNDVLYKVYMGKSEKLTKEHIFNVIPLKLDDKYNS